MILYFGDFDPDGWEIPRSALRNVKRLQELLGYDFPITLKRIALNMDQVQQYDPPPFEAKMTSSRFQGYVDEHDTYDAWELDALEPTVLQTLIRDNVAEHFDPDILTENRRIVSACRQEFRELMREPEWIHRALREV